jgi:hypothetical protein
MPKSGCRNRGPWTGRAAFTPRSVGGYSIVAGFQNLSSNRASTRVTLPKYQEKR